MVRTMWADNLLFHVMLSICLSHNPEVPFLDVYPKRNENLSSFKNLYANVTEALFIIIKNQITQMFFNCEWINLVCSYNEITQQYKEQTTWMGLR